MKKVIILVTIPLLLLIAAAAVMTFLHIGPFANLLPKTAALFEKSAAEPVAPSGKNIEMGTYIIPVVQNRSIRRQVGMDMAIEVDSGNAEKVGSKLTKLQNAYLLALYDFVPRQSNPVSDEARRAIHARLVNVGDGMFGQGAIRKVVIKAIYNR